MSYGDNDSYERAPGATQSNMEFSIAFLSGTASALSTACL